MERVAQQCLQNHVFDKIRAKKYERGAPWKVELDAYREAPKEDFSDDNEPFSKEEMLKLLLREAELVRK